MHVLGITDHLCNVGGAEISARDIMVSLAELPEVDHVTVIGLTASNTRPLDYTGVNVVPIKLPNFASKLPDFTLDVIVERLLSRTIKKNLTDVDVVHAHHRRGALAVSKLEPACPTVCTVRDYWPICPISIYHVGTETCTGCGNRLDDCISHQGWDGPAEPAVRAYLLAKRRHQQGVINDFDAAIFIAEHLRERLRDTVGFPRRTTVIPNPVPFPESVHWSPTNDPTFVTASSLTNAKGIDVAIRAFGKVVEVETQANLNVFGEGDERPRLEAMAAKVAPGAINFQGRVQTTEVYRAIGQAMATIVPSRWAEPFGRVTVESMALGTPVVGSDRGGTAELIDDGVNGLIFPSGDYEALAKQLLRIIKSQDFREDLSAAGRSRAQSFDPRKIAEAHLEFYASLTSN